MRLTTPLTLGLLCLVACNKPTTDTSKGSSDKKASKSDEAASEPKVDVTLPKAVKFEDPQPMEIGGKKVTAEVCKLDARGAEMKDKDFGDAIGDIVQAPDGTLYVLDHESKLRHYRVQSEKPCELALDTKFGKAGVLTLDDDKEKARDFTTLAVDAKGNVYVSGWRLALVSKGKLKPICEDKHGKMFIDASTGDAYVGQAHAKIDGADCKVDDKDMTFDGFKDPPQIDGAGNGMVFVFGRVGKVDAAGAYKHDGKKVALVGKETGDEDICNENAIVSCGFGVCVYDANCRSLRVWSRDGGKFLGAGDLNHVVGLTYVWPVGLYVGKDVAWMSFTHEQSEEAKKGEDSMHYGFIARVKGLN